MGCGSSNTSSRSPSTKQLAVTLPDNAEVSERRRVKTAKVVLLGESGVGKSSLALRFCQGRFSPFHEVTIGAAFLQQTVFFEDGNYLKLNIWDTGGQERFRAMAPLYYRDADGAIIVYDSNYAPSFEAIKFWVLELRQKGPQDCCMIIAANKSDLNERQISPKEVQAYCQSQGIACIDCSAKNGDNVGVLFERIARNIAMASNVK